MEDVEDLDRFKSTRVCFNRRLLVEWRQLSARQVSVGAEELLSLIRLGGTGPVREGIHSLATQKAVR